MTPAGHDEGRSKIVIVSLPTDKIESMMGWERVENRALNRLRIYRAKILGTGEDGRSTQLAFVFCAKSDVAAAKRVKQKLATLNREEKTRVDNPVGQEIIITDAKCWALYRIVREITLYMWDSKLLYGDGEVLFLEN